MLSFTGQFLKTIAKSFAAPAMAISLVTSAASAATSGDDLSQGLDAYQAHNFNAALKHFRQAAEGGNPEAELHLGAMYFNGHGVAQDRDEAARWFHKAALQGNLEAQYILGVLYWDGRGVAKDYVASYMWFNIASTNGSDSARTSVSRIAANLSSPDISEAERRARACLESNYRNCD